MITRKKTVKSGTTIHYSVSAPGYITQEGDVLMDSDKTLNITLQQVSPDPPTPTGNWATWTGGYVTTFVSGTGYFGKTSPITKTQYPQNLTYISFENSNSLTSVDFLDGTYLTALYFKSCPNLVSLPVIDCSNVVDAKIFTGDHPSLTTLGGFVNLGKGINPDSTLDLSQAPNLTKQSVLNLFSGLYNISGSGNTGTIILTQALVDSLSNDERTFATNKGWTLLPNPTPPTPDPEYWAVWDYGKTSAENIYWPDDNYPTVIGGVEYYKLSSPIAKAGYTGNMTRFSLMDNTSVQTVSVLDTSNITDFSGMFWNCPKLTSIPQLDTSNVTSFKAMFRGCDSLTSIPPLDTHNGRNFGSMFMRCTGLTSIPQLDTSNSTDFSNMFYECDSLTSLPQLNTSKGLNFLYMFKGCTSLTTVAGLLGCRYSVTFGDCPLTHQSALNVINSLGIAADPNQSITFSPSTYNTLDAVELQVALNKGWMVGVILPD